MSGEIDYIFGERDMGTDYEIYSLIYCETQTEINEHVSESVRELNSDKLFSP